MRYVWEEELLPQWSNQQLKWGHEWHLKHVIQQPEHDRSWKVSQAWVRKIGDRKYRAIFMTTPMGLNDKTFRSLKAAKAYALAIVRLT